MYDIHSHILPGVDDGAKSMDISVLMAEALYEKGVQGIVATPHYIKDEYVNSKSIVVEAVEKLNNEIIERGMDIKVYTGNEVFLSHEIPELFEKREILTLNESKYMLIELPMSIIPDYTEEVFFQLQLREVIPIIAHPERNHEIMRNPKRIIEFIEKGAVTQLNLGSIMGVYGYEVRRCAEKLLDMCLVWFIASDSHSNKGTRINIDRAYDAVKYKYGEYNADLLFNKNPCNAINNKEIFRIEKYNKPGILDRIKFAFKNKKDI